MADQILQCPDQIPRRQLQDRQGDRAGRHGINDPLLNQSLQGTPKALFGKKPYELLQGQQSHDIKMLDAQILDATRSIQENLKNLIQVSEESLKSINQRIEQQEEHMAEVPRRQNQLKYTTNAKSTLFPEPFNYLSRNWPNGDQQKKTYAISRCWTSHHDRQQTRNAQNKLIMLIGVLVNPALPLTWIIIHESSMIPYRISCPWRTPPTSQ